MFRNWILRISIGKYSHMDIHLTIDQIERYSDYYGDKVICCLPEVNGCTYI